MHEREPRDPRWDVVALHVDLAQHGAPVATCRSLYLARRVGRRDGPKAEVPAVPEAPWLRAEWAFAADEGRRYAALSGDRNPIHLHPLLSRWFGFPRPILHGMDGVARAHAALERAAGRPVSRLDARFDRPLPLPGRAAFAAWEADEGAGFALGSPDGAARHVDGQAAFG